MTRLITFFIVLCSIFSVQATHSNTSNLREKDTIVVGYNIDPPFCYLEQGNLEGISVRMWKKITNSHTNKVFVYKQKPLDSLLEGLSNGTLDLSLSPITITSKRNAKIDFSIPYFISQCKGLIKSKSKTSKLKAFISSFFSFNFFKVIGSLLLLLTIFGSLVWVFEHKRNKEEFGDGLHGLFNGIWWSAVTMTTVGYGDKSPKTAGGRVVGLIWMFSAIILISSITASITSSLTVDKLKVSEADYASFKAYEIGTVKQSATENWLIDHYFNHVTSYHTFQELVNALDEDKIEAIAYDEPLIRFYLKNMDDKKYEVSKFSFNKSMYAMAFSKSLDRTYKTQLSDDILRFIETDDWRVLLANYDLSDLNN